LVLLMPIQLRHFPAAHEDRPDVGHFPEGRSTFSKMLEMGFDPFTADLDHQSNTRRDQHCCRPMTVPWPEGVDEDTACKARQPLAISTEPSRAVDVLTERVLSTSAPATRR
jgi:hypothetical protein